MRVHVEWARRVEHLAYSLRDPSGAIQRWMTRGDRTGISGGGTRADPLTLDQNDVGVAGGQVIGARDADHPTPNDYDPLLAQSRVGSRTTLIDADFRRFRATESASRYWLRG